MAKILSLFGDSGKSAFPHEELQAARDCITQALQDDRADFIAPLRNAHAQYPDNLRDCYG